MKYENHTNLINKNIFPQNAIKIDRQKFFFKYRFHSFIIHSFIPKCFLGSTNVSEDLICLNVKDSESKEVETKTVRNAQT